MMLLSEMANLTWIKTSASVVIKGFGGPNRLSPFRMDEQIFKDICTMAGHGSELWWRHDDWHRGAKSDEQWGWCFGTPYNEEEYAKWKMSKVDWEIDMWFREADKAALVKLWLPNPTSV